MQNIVIFGAGRSATSLIKYLLREAQGRDWHVTVADMSLDLAVAKIGDSAHATAVQCSADDTPLRRSLIERAAAVVSMLPVSLHQLVADDCLSLGKSLFNASYISDHLRSIDAQVQAKGLLFLCELGLDPGIDHMSAMQIIHELREQGAKIEAFRSYTGGLVAPESDDNPWHYKFSWNPRNVVVAGQSTAKYLHAGQMRYVPYPRLFAEAETVHILGMGDYEIYPNRDSLGYRSAYLLDDVPTLLRATIRHKGFSRAWYILAQLGLTDDAYALPHSATLSYREFFASFLPPHLLQANKDDIRATLAQLFRLPSDDAALAQIEWLEIYSDQRRVTLKNATPAQILQALLEEKWLLRPEEKDMVIMQHEFTYVLQGKRYRRLSTLVQYGDNATDTAMSNLVGLPLAIGVKQYLLGNLQASGVRMPNTPDLYTPIMAELASIGVRFEEQVTELEGIA